MIFPVHVLCGYPSYETAGTKWNDDDYRASNLVKAVKHRSFKGYAKFRTTTIDDTPRGRERALRLVAAAAVQKLTQNGLAGTLVALPASNHICFGSEFTGSRITDAIAALDVRFQSRPVLRFEQIMLKAAEGGTRNPAVIAASLDHQGPLDFQSCILVDDVKSTGGSFEGRGAIPPCNRRGCCWSILFGSDGQCSTRQHLRHTFGDYQRHSGISRLLISPRATLRHQIGRASGTRPFRHIQCSHNAGIVKAHRDVISS